MPQWMLFAVLGLGSLVVLVACVGPKESVDRDFTAQIALPTDIDGWLDTREADIPNLKDGVEKRVVWAGTPGVQTETSIVYIHGFSASSEEIRPVPDRVAEALGANLYFARLAGHGRDGPAMAEPVMGDWAQDYAEAMAIGRQIGERVIVIATSTGGTLTALGTVEGDAPDAAIFVSPNFELATPAGKLLNLRSAEWLLPLLTGEERGFDPRNEGHATYWTTRYPLVATLPMAALMREVKAQDMSGVTTPALFLISETDRVVSPQATEAFAARWGGPAQVTYAALDEDDDPFGHVIAGDIMSPGQTDWAVQTMLDWIKAL